MDRIGHSFYKAIYIAIRLVFPFKDVAVKFT